MLPWILFVAAIVTGGIVGGIMIWLQNRRDRILGEKVNEYVDLLMEFGPSSSEAFVFRATHAKKSKDLAEALNTARSLYLAVYPAQKTGDRNDI